MQAVDLLGALLLGIGAGLGGRGFAWLVRRAKGLGKDSRRCAACSSAA